MVRAVTVDVADWVVGDGEFGPVEVGDVVTVGLALVDVQPADPDEPVATDTLRSTPDGRYEVRGTLSVPLTDDGRRLPAVVRADEVTLVLLGDSREVGEGEVRLHGRLTVEPFHWAAPGGLLERHPEGVRPWRIAGIRTRVGTVLSSITSVDEGGGLQSYRVDLEPVAGPAPA